MLDHDNRCDHKPLTMHLYFDIAGWTFLVLPHDRRDLREFARTNFAHFSAPHDVTFVKELSKLRPARFKNEF